MIHVPILTISPVNRSFWWITFNIQYNKQNKESLDKWNSCPIFLLVYLAASDSGELLWTTAHSSRGSARRPHLRPHSWTQDHSNKTANSHSLGGSSTQRSIQCRHWAEGSGRQQHPLPLPCRSPLCQARSLPVSIWGIPWSRPQSHFLSHSSAEAASYVFPPLLSSFFLLLFASLQLTGWVLHFWAFALKFKKTHFLHTFAAHLKLCYFICLKVKIEYIKDTVVYKMKTLST